MDRTSPSDTVRPVGQLARTWWNAAPRFEALVLLGALATFLFAVPFGDFDTIIGDNIAQVAYFRVLFRENLIGSIGASSMKPGLVLLLGVAHDLSLALFDTTVLVKVVFALFAAALTTLVARIAKDAAGLLAGALAAVYLVTCTPVPSMYTIGSSMIVFLPLLFAGLWLFTRGHQRAGAVVLCLAALTRIEALAVLGWLCAVEQLWRRNWRGVLFTGAVTGATIVLTALVYFRLQGSVARFNAGGPPAGYIFTRDPSGLHRLKESLEYTVSASYETLAQRCGPPSLVVPALLGACLDRSRRTYAALLGVPLFLNVYFGTGNGSPEIRYFEFLVPAAACFGAAGLAAALRFGRSAPSRPRRLAAGALAALGGVSFLLGAHEVAYSAALTLVVGGLGALDEAALVRRSPRLAPALAWVALAVAASLPLVRGRWSRQPGRASYTLDARHLLASKKIPRHSRVLTEDDVIYSVIARAPDFFARATALQYFNIKDDDARRKILDATDYVAVSHGQHSFYFLRYDPQKRGDADPFRAAVEHNQSATLYGHRLKLIDKSPAMSLYKVQPADG